VWSGPDGQGRIADDSYPVPRNGQWWKPGMARRPPMYALSRGGVMPSRSITWFQANEACAASGKRLMAREEWFLAIQGTVDGAGCRINEAVPRQTGQGSGCESIWGAQDLIGNLWEWTAEWYASVGTWNAGTMTGGLAKADQSWPAGYNDDRTWNIASRVGVAPGAEADGMPAAALRGGDWAFGSRAGAFALSLYFGPSNWGPGVGLRCVVRR
jgi:formylglycine-generating enzyme required for sulfatase activity